LKITNNNSKTWSTPLKPCDFKKNMKTKRNPNPRLEQVHIQGFRIMKPEGLRSMIVRYWLRTLTLGINWSL
jgi:hypothetical protein